MDKKIRRYLIQKGLKEKGYLNDITPPDIENDIIDIVKEKLQERIKNKENKFQDRLFNQIIRELNL